MIAAQRKTNTSQLKWIAFLAGSVIGLIFGLYRWFTTTASLKSVAVIALISGVVSVVILATIVDWHRQLQPSRGKLNARVNPDNCFIAEWKLRWLRHLLTEDKNNPENSEREILHVEGWYWIKLVRDAWLAFSVMLFFLWGLLRFPGLDSLQSWLADLLRPDNMSRQEIAPPLGLLLVVAGFVWYLRKTEKWKQLARRSTGPVIVMLAGFWGLLGFPGADWLEEAFRSDSRLPWVYATLASLLWTLLNSIDFFFGGVFVTKQRVVRFRVPPPFFRKVVDPLNFENIVGGTLDRSPVGNILKYGEVVVKEQGEQEKQTFHHLEPLRHYQELYAVVNLLTQRRHPA